MGSYTYDKKITDGIVSFVKHLAMMLVSPYGKLFKTMARVDTIMSDVRSKIYNL